MNTISKKQFRNYIQDFDFTHLFNQLGWNFVDEHFPVKLKDETYHFHAVAEKGGFRIIISQPTKTVDLPDYNTRLQLDRKIARLYREHLLIFTDCNQTTQIWQLFVKQMGKPSRLSETRWHKGQEPELLYQKTSHLFFTLDEEENITIADVVERVNDNFSKNVEQVTKKFYESFRKEHQKFIAFIEGISVVTDREWYASLMLNRLMFCYFIQKKGFLDNNPNYLKEKLLMCQQRKGKDQFYVSFYKNFLMALFHQGLGSPVHDSEFQKELGRIPYLNGGLFDVHDLEKNYNIDIGDDAFIKVFEFFDQYNWHLDTRVNASGKDINPDVIGYIFEKYINDRAQMGAYYTKEDITDYISKNCVIPYLFDETARNHPKAFKPGAEMWQMLRESGDEYIYPAVKHGVLLPSPNGEGPGERLLPDEIAIGLDTTQPNLLERRAAWNKPAPPEYALPTEIWREVVDRRNRYAEVKAKIDNGEINQINDFITYNLNIRQFAQDAIENTTDPDFLRHFYKSLNSVTILDPTCGSGAFLFAAMNILEPLYEACITRMRGFTEDEDEENKQEKINFSNKYKFFRDKLAEIQNEHHPNQAYFIYKSIILNNLYGVDIMKEAVEIAKLRLFLKLVATVEADYRKPNLGLEPLPDVDFNIRAGNTLVGFATEKELDDSFVGVMDFDDDKGKLKEKCDIVARTFKHYKAIQLGDGDDYAGFKQAKDELTRRLAELNHQLNIRLAKQYGIDYDPKSEKSVNLLQSWYRQYQPFHWFAEFYEIVQARGGFDVIIGNPPYVAIKDIDYKPKNFETLECGDIYALCIERSIKHLLNYLGKIGMIVPISIVSTDGYSSLRKVLIKSQKEFYYANFAVRPSKLFDGVDKRLSIFISSEGNKSHFSTKYYRWISEEREVLFSKISFQPVKNDIYNISGYSKISSPVERNILQTLSKKKLSIAAFIIKTSGQKIKYTRKLQYFIQFFENPPIIYDINKNIVEPSELKEISVRTEDEKFILISALNSNLFFWFFITFSDCRNVNSREILKFPIDLGGFDKLTINRLKSLSISLMNDFIKNAIFQLRNDKRAGTLEIQSYQPRLSKPIIDEIDKVLAEHYGFTEEELDFIINYDIKYRMGKELEEEV